MNGVPGGFSRVPKAAADPTASPWGLSRRAKWDLALGISGVVYVVLTLALNLDMPLLSFLFVGLAGHELVAGRGR